MLLAALGSVRIGKNCDLGLENAALGLGQHFYDLRHCISQYGPPSRQIKKSFDTWVRFKT